MTYNYKSIQSLFSDLDDTLNQGLQQPRLPVNQFASLPVPLEHLPLVVHAWVDQVVRDPNSPDKLFLGCPEAADQGRVVVREIDVVVVIFELRVLVLPGHFQLGVFWNARFSSVVKLKQNLGSFSGHGDQASWVLQCSHYLHRKL
ncbi:hypothetical protein RchiOBHm_Chr3g0480331 [Rosa chinensis]|uniref:Uncharacterized protein n=1 Tax=Rosa chinensis TaxID=74649 RepID=A0A2P6RDQ9_ROSCH|nr:hypothetical protein RchiOBHm_Chr3g0480331 [Rosa chinensis]